MQPSGIRYMQTASMYTDMNVCVYLRVCMLHISQHQLIDRMVEIYTQLYIHLCMHKILHSFDHCDCIVFGLYAIVKPEKHLT